MAKTLKIAVLAGDGSAPEFMAAALKVLGALGKKFGLKFDFHEAPVGGAAYDRHGHPLPP
ncbi:MAG: isocitrate/isopropylmalate family dehydrogenase, partial [Candidatus Binatia bacterium]